MGEQATSDTPDEADLEADVDTVIAACGGSERGAIRALLIANEFLSTELERAREKQSVGYVRGDRAINAQKMGQSTNDQSGLPASFKDEARDG
jgi:hypothetical protein